MSEHLTKTLRIFASTHTILKVNAATAGVSIKEYLRQIVEVDNADTGTKKQEVPDNNNAD